MRELFDGLNNYKTKIPNVHAGYLEIMTALEIIMDKNLVSKKEFKKLWSGPINSLKKFGKTYYFITGYAMRAQAKNYSLKESIKQAQKKILDTINWYEKTQNEREEANTYYEAALLLPENRNEYIRKGIALCSQNGYALDLIRFQKLEK